MALYESVTGSGTVVSESETVRNLREAGESYYNVEENIKTEVREWVALTYAAASAAKSAGTGEAQMNLNGTSGVVYEHSVDEDNRVIGSYIYRCSAEVKTISFV